MSAPDLVSLLRQRIEESLTKRDRSVLAIVGSGVSIQATGKAPAASWGGLLRLGSARCELVAANWRTRRFDAAGVQVKLASPKVADWVSAATEIEKTLKAAKASVYKDWLRETLGELKPIQPEVLYALGALGVPLATTNYDGLLEHALGLQGATWRTHGLVDQILTGTYPGNAVLHLHGHFSEPESVILGADSYEKILGDKRAQSTLRHLLMSRDLIFVGMGGGLDDPNFGALIDWALDVTLPESRYHFLLLREAETHAYRARISLTSRIHVVSYGADYPDLVPFLRSLAPGAGGTGAASSGSAGSAAQGNLSSAWVRQSPAAQVPVTRNLVRRAFFDTFLTDASGDAFCEDHFFSTYQQFSAGMEREQKVNVLLSREDPEVVFARLTEYLQTPTPRTTRSQLAVQPTPTPVTMVPSTPPSLPQPTPLRPSPPPPETTSTPPSATKTETKQAVWNALLRLDRIKQWNSLVTSISDPNKESQLVLLSGSWDQKISLFIQRIEEHLREHIPTSEVIKVPLQLSSDPATNAARWGIHLNDVLGAKLGVKGQKLPPAQLLARATQKGPLVVVLVALLNPLQPLSTLTSEQQEALGGFLSELLPKRLADTRRITVLLPLEYRLESQSLLPWARECAKTKWNAYPLSHAELDRLTLPTWDEVEEYLRRYPKRLPLDTLVPQVKTLYQELSQPGITFDLLATEINNIILRQR